MLLPASDGVYADLNTANLSPFWNNVKIWY